MKIIIGTYRADKAMIERCVDSIGENVQGYSELWFVDDSGDNEFRGWLERYGNVVGVGGAGENLGYAKAMDRVCKLMRMFEDEYVMFWEEDFTAVVPVDLDEIRDEMRYRPNLAQVVLLRQPVFHGEKETGSVIGALSERLGGHYERVGPLVMHDMTFSCNPAVWAPMAYRWPWPQCNDSEDAKTRYLVEDDYACFAFWGDEVLVHHDGERSGTGY